MAWRDWLWEPARGQFCSIGFSLSAYSVILYPSVLCIIRACNANRFRCIPIDPVVGASTVHQSRWATRSTAHPDATSDGTGATYLRGLSRNGGEWTAEGHLHLGAAGNVWTSSTRRSKPQASTNRRAVATVGLAWPASYGVMAERDVAARLESSVRVNPARFRVRRIAEPSVVAITPRTRSHTDGVSEGRIARGLGRRCLGGSVARRDGLGPQSQPEFVAEQLVLGAAASVRLAVL